MVKQVKKAFTAVGLAAHRRWLTREVRYWGDMLEALERERLTHAGRVDVAVERMQAAKRAISMMDGPQPRPVRYAPGAGPSDGIKRFAPVFIEEVELVDATTDGQR